MIRKFRKFYTFRATAALGPALAAMMAVVGTHAAGQDEVGGESLPSAVEVSSAVADTARPVAVIHRRDIECMATAQVEQAQDSVPSYSAKSRSDRTPGAAAVPFRARPCSGR